MKKWKLAIIMLVVALLLAACGSNEDADRKYKDKSAANRRKNN